MYAHGGENKARKTGIEGRKQGLLKKWLDRDKQSSEEIPQSPKKKAKAREEPEPTGLGERKSRAKGLLGT